MADNENIKALKDLPIRIQTSKLKEREQVFADLTTVLSKTDVNENVIKGICRLLGFTLPRYQNSKSRRIVLDLVVLLAKQHPNATFKHLTTFLADYAKVLKNVAPTESTAHCALTVFTWSCALIQYTLKQESTFDQPEFQNLVETQAILLMSIVAVQKKRYNEKLYKKLSLSWTLLDNNIQHYADKIAALEPSPQSIIFASYLIRYLSECKKLDLASKYTSVFIDELIKVIISCKIKPQLFVVTECKPLLRQIKHQEFQDTILPVIQKSMLRNPEIILESVAHIVDGVSIDLSQYAMDIGKTLTANLHSKEDLSREEAALACLYLGKQCSDSTSLQHLLEYMFGVFNGSEGKITALAHKWSILQGIGNLSQNTVSGTSIQGLSSFVSDHFKKILETEAHENTLIHALDMWAQWCTRFTIEVPTTAVEWIKTGLTLKTSTALVRNAYINCMSKCFHGNTMLQGLQFIPILMKTVEKAAGQPTQIAVVTEGVSAAVLLVRLSVADVEGKHNLNQFWKIILDADAQLFLSDKFLMAASDDALYHVVVLYEQIFNHHANKIQGKCLELFCKALIFCMIRPNPKMRRQCHSVVKKLVNDGELARALLTEFTTYLESAKVKNPDVDGTNGDETSSSPGEIHPNVLAECLITLCSNVSDTALNEQLAFDSLLPSHHPGILAVQKNFWEKLVKGFKMKPDEFVKKYSHNLVKKFITEYKPTPTIENVIKTLVRLCPDDITPKLVDHVAQQLHNTAFAQVTRDDYFTYLTPEGELYDRSVIENAQHESALNAKNIKRESKAYSYKEQMEEIQLRRELEDKQRKEGKRKKEPELTPKQKEIFKTQLEKEAAIRTRVGLLKETVTNVVSLIKATAAGNQTSLCAHFPTLLEVILHNMSSPVAAAELTQLYVGFRKCVFNPGEEFLGLSVAHVTLRLLQPQCDLDPAWQEEDLDMATDRVIQLLHNQTIDSNRNFTTQEDNRNLLSAPAFCYCFLLFKAVLSQPALAKKEAHVIRTLNLISAHIQMRGSEDGDKVDLYHPDFLPRRQILDLMIQLVGTASSRIQQLASEVILEVAMAASGMEGCAIATEEEINSLLNALQSPSEAVRDAALRGIGELIGVIPDMDEKADVASLFLRRIWVAKCDVSEIIRSLATTLWDESRLEIYPSLWEDLLTDVVDPVEPLRLAAAEALAACTARKPKVTAAVLERLMITYKEKLVMSPPKLDSFGRVLQEPIDYWEPRSGIACALTKLAPHYNQQMVIRLIGFMVPTALADRSVEVRKYMLEASLAVVELHGKESVNDLLEVFEGVLDKSPDTSSYDTVRQSVVVLMGSLARHLDKDDKRIRPIVAKLMHSLATPSQQVQEAVANCLPGLIPAIRDQAPSMVERLLQQLLDADSYGERKGAAYGLAGLVKGLGILSLKEFGIMVALTEAIQDKRNYRHREGALFAFEMLCNMLGRLFEPYIIHVLPHLLLCFGDSSQYVREATEDTARAVMSKLSAHGVKLVLPSLLAGLEEELWRTKTGSVELLGSMAYCAPKQLSSCLPSIVPKLIEVLSDSHTKVQKAGAQALRQIGSVIKNPEIQAIVPDLLDALQNPAKKTATCLVILLDTKFVHFIDAPSLALIMPVVQRAFQDRSTETRKMAAQIIGNMYSLTDQKDLAPYLPNILPGLQASLLDPVPEVRSVSARALGAMARGMGEASFQEVLPWLMQMLTSETSAVDRSGSAQGLSEVVGGLGVEKLHKLMPEIISTAERNDIAAHVKDGYIMMFIYMPVVFQKDFTPYIGKIINPILKALSDENEFVRDTAMKAGQRIVNMYADTAIALLLPELEQGLFDDNWRIRHSSVQLLGDLLYRISGVTGKMTTETVDEDDNFGTEQSHKAIITALSFDRRNRVLAGLYMGRSDVALLVRQAALHVWKVVVSNTPRTLREILPTLFTLLLGCLASKSYDKRQVAARTLGDLVRKLGERILPEIIPILEEGLLSQEPDQRQGVCIGLSEIMAATSREMVMNFVDSLVPTVRKALSDPLPEVRQAAAKTFDSLHNTVGTRALDEILPNLLQQLSDPKVAEYTLDGLRQIMAIKSKAVLPYMVPQLIQPPCNTRALAILASVAGDAVTKHLPRILPALVVAMKESHGTTNHQKEMEYCQTIILAVSDEFGVHTIMDDLLEGTRSPNIDVRRASVTLLCAFCTNTKADYSQYVSHLLRGLIHLFAEHDPDVLQMSWEALHAVTKTLNATEQLAKVSDLRQAVRFAIGDLKTGELLPGFCLAKGIAPVLPVFREAILNGNAELKEQGSQGLAEVIRVTSADALKPSVVHITGPLIRILGDRFSWTVKVAVLETLTMLLDKVHSMLKPFLPQLQTTFLKSLNDPTKQVRIKAGTALGALVVIHNRPDPLFMELHAHIRSTDETIIRDTSLQAMRSVITTSGNRIVGTIRRSVLQSLHAFLTVTEDTTRSSAAGCLGAFCTYLDNDELDLLVNDHMLNDDLTLDWTLRHGRSALLSVGLKESPTKVYQEDWQARIHKTLLAHLTADRVPIAMNGLRGCTFLFKYLEEQHMPLPTQLITPFTRQMNHTSNDMKQLLAQCATFLANSFDCLLRAELVKPLLPMLVNGTKEKNTMVKANSEVALIAVLRIHHDEETQMECLDMLEPGARESLSDVLVKVIRKAGYQPEGKEEEIDETLLT